MTATAELATAAVTFADLRPRLVGIAYRILGRRVDAEDAVQDVWVRWQRCDRSTVVNPTAFLVTTTRRVAVNAGRTARVRHESYEHHALPERTEPSGTEARTELADTLEHAVGLLLARLNPTERAAFVLREAFDYPYPRISALLGVSEVNARQLVSRAGRRLATGGGRPGRGDRSCRDRAHQRRWADTLLRAARHGELAALERMVLSGVG